MKIGEVKYAKEIGRQGAGKWIWLPCSDCGKERWTFLKGDKPSIRCRKCACGKMARESIGVKNGKWKGGRLIDAQGYVSVLLRPDDFFYSMAMKSGYVLEHRLVMAWHLGRCLQPFEKVHHKDGIRDHNECSNLKMSTAGSHAIEHSKGYRDGYRQGYQDAQSETIRELKQEIKLLQWQIKEKLSIGVIEGK